MRRRRSSPHEVDHAVHPSAGVTRDSLLYGRRLDDAEGRKDTVDHEQVLVAVDARNNAHVHSGGRDSGRLYIHSDISDRR